MYLEDRLADFCGYDPRNLNPVYQAGEGDMESIRFASGNSQKNV